MYFEAGTEEQPWRTGSGAAQVLWHTAAAFAGGLLAAAALPAEQLSEQAASLAADRLERQQATNAAVMTVKEVDEGKLNCLPIRQKSCCWHHPRQRGILHCPQGFSGYCERGSSLSSAMFCTA